MLVSRENLRAIFTGFQLTYQNALAQAPSQWARVATEVTSTNAEERYGWLGNLPDFREWLGDRVMNSLSASDFTIKNKPFELSYELDRDDIEDDKFGLLSPAVQMAGYRAATHPDTLLFALLTNGFTSLCYDGQYFFDTDHPVTLADGTQSTWSNFQGGAGTAWYLLDCRMPIKPLVLQKRRDYQFVALTSLDDEAVFNRKKHRFGVDARLNVGYGLPQMAYASKQTLDVTNYAAARGAMGSLVGDRGVRLAVSGNILVVPPTLEKAAKDIVAADRLANGGTNTMAGTAEVLVCPWL